MVGTWVRVGLCTGLTTAPVWRLVQDFSKHKHTRAAKWARLCWCVWATAFSRYQINQQAGRCKWLAYTEPAAPSQNSHSTMDRWLAGPHQPSHTSVSFCVSLALSVPSFSSKPHSIPICLLLTNGVFCSLAQFLSPFFLSPQFVLPSFCPLMLYN